MTHAELSRDEPKPTESGAGTSVAQSRRARNAAHRADDVGEQLLVLRPRALQGMWNFFL